MGVLILIPARYASSRFPGKPLVPLRGASGTARSLIERTWRAASAVRGADRIAVATDDARIADEARRIGAEVVMTSSDWVNGTERCAEAADALAGPDDIVVNLQGDAPLTPPGFVDSLVDAMAANQSIQVATPVLRCDEHALEGFLADRKAGRVGGTTAVFDGAGRALYFSKEVIPFAGGRLAGLPECPVFHHVGVYAYRREALSRYPELPVGPLETVEGLEQLRFMENGMTVHCVKVRTQNARFWEVNNPEDVARVEAVLAEQNTD